MAIIKNKPSLRQKSQNIGRSYIQKVAKKHVPGLTFSSASLIALDEMFTNFVRQAAKEAGHVCTHQKRKILSCEYDMRSGLETIMPKALSTEVLAAADKNVEVFTKASVKQ